MQNIIKAAINSLALALAAPEAAQDFDAGVEAYRLGDYSGMVHERR
jgi:hypothetical protein